MIVVIKNHQWHGQLEYRYTHLNMKAVGIFEFWRKDGIQSHKTYRLL